MMKTECKKTSVFFAKGKNVWKNFLSDRRMFREKIWIYEYME